MEGRIVSRGYLNDAERTRQVFLDDAPWLPQSSTSPSVRRLYKTGDIVRLMEDGTFSFVGRKDNQVKLHGQRVELSEIEYHLKVAVPDVHTAIALLNTASPEHTNRHLLIAFLSINKQSAAVNCVEGRLSMSLTPQGLDLLRKARTVLSTVLPSYMVPSLYIPIHHVPFTANGKRDVAKLRQITQNLSQEDLMAFSLSQETNSAVTTLSPQETQLRDLWAKVLHINSSNIQPDSDFIRKGGDSLTSMHLASEAMKEGLHLPVSHYHSEPSTV